MSFLIYIFVVAVLEIALVLNVRYLFSRHPLTTFIAVIVFLIGLIPPFIKLQNMHHEAPIYTIFLAFIFCVDLMFVLIMIYYYIRVRHYERPVQLKKADYIVVLGSKFMSNRVPPIMMSRLDKAIQIYYRFDKTPQIIVSGGKSSIAKIKESTIMRQYLLEKGIPDKSIIVEDKSKDTAENLEYSSIVVKNDWKNPTAPNIAVVTSEFHIPRAKKFAEKISFVAQFVPALTLPIFKWPAMFREFTAIIWYYRYTIETIMLTIIVILICTFVP